MTPPLLNVTLTRTTNTYLRDYLPLRGQIELFEFGVDGLLIKAVFRTMDDDGRLGPPVVVDEPDFAFTTEGSRNMFRMIRAAEQSRVAAGSPSESQLA